MTEGRIQDRLRTARRLVHFGCSVIPLQPRSKRPDGGLVPSWTQYQERRPTDAELMTWFPPGSERNIGIVTGAISGVVVVDCDSPEARAWADTHLPKTPVQVVTGGGGEHRFYRHPGVPVRNKVRLRTGEAQLALDVRADGGYVCAPGSVHESGRTYRAPTPWPEGLKGMPVFDPQWIQDERPAVPVPAPLAIDADIRVKRARAYLAQVPPAIEGQGGDAQTFVAACRVSRGFDLAVDEAWPLLAEWNARCVPPWSERELLKKLENADRYGSEPRGHLLNDRPSFEVRLPSALSTPPLPDAVGAYGPVLVRLADVQPERVTWLWTRRIARGKFSLLMGDPGVGKSYITGDVAARVSRGLPWPDGGSAPRGPVIFLAAEDGLADTLRPRLDALGADVTQIHVLKGVRDESGERPLSFQTDLAHLRSAIRQIRPVLVVVDPVSSYLGDRDSYKDAEVRSVLMPLVQLAEDEGVAILGLIHVTKDGQRRALYRALGSVAIPAIARIVLAAGADPDNPDRRYLMWVKGNGCAPAPTLAYRIVPRAEGEAAAFEWEADPVEGVHPDTVLAGAAVRSGEERAAMDEATAFLRELLADDRLVPAGEVQEQADAAGISKATLRRAKTALGIVTEKLGFRNGWGWRLQPKVLTKSTTPCGLSTFGDSVTVSPLGATAFPKVLNPQDLSTFGEQDRGWGDV